jgi:hypothetical protein
VNQVYTGRSKYRTDLVTASGSLEVAVACRVGLREAQDVAMLDTACPWCILPPLVAVELGYALETDGDIRLHTRFGLLAGEVIRLPITFVPDEGEPVEIEATWFLSPDWPGPMVIGWMGCLQRMRFGFDPRENDFYFAELSS